MTSKPLVRRAQARREIDDAIDHYLREGGVALALRFVDAIDQANDLIQHPSAGSPRYAHLLDVPGLRTLRVKGFPYVFFYIEHRDRADVWRFLHGHRDVLAELEIDLEE